METKPTYQTGTITIETAPPTPVEIVQAGTMARLEAAEKYIEWLARQLAWADLPNKTLLHGCELLASWKDAQ